MFGRLMRPGGVVQARRPPIVEFGLPSHYSGQLNLSPSLTINGTTVAAALRYHLSDFAAGSLVEAGGDADGTLTETGAGSLTGSQPSPFLDGTAGVLGDGTNHLVAAGNTFGNVGTDDIFFAAAVKPSGDVTQYFAGKRLNSGTYPGYVIGHVAGGVYVWAIDDGVDYAYSTAASNAGAQVDIFCGAVNRDEASTNGLFAFCNGAAGSGANGSAAAGTLDAVAPFGLMSRQSGLSIWAGTLYYFGLWHSADWFSSGATGAAEMLAAAKEVTSRLTGTYANHAPPGANAPAVTRATTRTFQVGANLHTLGSGAHCIEEDADGDQHLSIYGARTNLCLQANDLTATWTKEDAGDTVTASTIAGDATDDVHGVTQDITLTAVQHCFSAEGETGGAAGNKDWIRLVNSTVANADCYFDVANGTVGTEGAGVADSGIIQRGDKYRCWFTFLGTVAAHTFAVRPAHADGDDTFAGDGSTVNTTITNVQVEAGDGPGPVVPTTDGAATKNAENIDLDTDVADRLAATNEGTFECEVKTSSLNRIRYLFSLNDGSNDNRLIFYLDGSGRAAAYVAVGGVAQANFFLAGDIQDGSWHKVKLSWKTGRIVIEADGSTAIDAGGTFPSAVDRFHLARSVSDTSHLGGEIRRVRIYDYARL